MRLIQCLGSMPVSDFSNLSEPNDSNDQGELAVSYR